MSVDAHMGNRGHERARRIALQAASILALLIAWVVVSEGMDVDPMFVPSPADLWNRFDLMRDQLPGALAYSLVIILGGFAIGVVSGVVVALAMAYSVVVRESTEAIINALRPVPIFALIPLFLLWFGIGYTSQVGLVAFGVFVILVVSTAEAIRNVPAIFVNAGRTLGASRRRIFSTVVVPAILPNLIGAIRVAAAASFGLDVAAEFIGAQNGLGYMLINSAAYLYTDGIIVIIIIYSLLSFALDRLLMLSSKRVTRWSGRLAS
jgi:ABC-type nitrate/sulfonate/bicarbonate transport system permease component